MDITNIKGLIISKVNNDYEFEKNPLLINYGFMLTLIQEEDRSYLTIVDYKNNIEISIPNEVLPYLIESFSMQLNKERINLLNKLEKLDFNITTE